MNIITNETMCATSCKAAIALSNTGVSFLEGGQFCDAMQTISGAIDLIRSAIPDQEIVYRNYSCHLNKSKIEQLLHHASQRLAQTF
jgi:hypothetical protein